MLRYLRKADLLLNSDINAAALKMNSRLHGMAVRLKSLGVINVRSVTHTFVSLNGRSFTTKGEKRWRTAEEAVT